MHLSIIWWVTRKMSNYNDIDQMAERTQLPRHPRIGHELQVAADFVAGIVVLVDETKLDALQELVTFNSSDTQGMSVYHTNVLMAIGTDVAVACLDSVTDARERQHLKGRLSKHHEVWHFEPTLL